MFVFVEELVEILGDIAGSGFHVFKTAVQVITTLFHLMLYQQ